MPKMAMKRAARVRFSRNNTPKILPPRVRKPMKARPGPAGRIEQGPLQDELLSGINADVGPFDEKGGRRWRGQRRHKLCAVNAGDVTIERIIARLADRPQGMIDTIFHATAVALTRISPMVIG